jgi:signal transduction histidine kinase/CheY-like chemotaxis protein
VKPNDRYPWWTSLVARSTFVLALLLMLAAFGTAWLVHRAARDRVLAQAQADDRHVLDLAAQRLGSYAITLDDDIAFLADNAPLRAYTAALDAGDTALARAALLDLSSLMRSFLRSRPTYAQVRYIAADSAGMEIVRFNAKAGVVEQVPDSLLQPKGDRDFHRATMALPGDRRYFSAMDLNMEHGTVERPLVPTLRAALGIDRPSGIRAGIVVINADLRPLFDELASLQPPHATLLLADEAGQLLLHPDSARCFHVLLGRGEGLAAELAAASDAERWSVVRRTVRPERLPYALTLVVRRDLSPLLAELKAGRDRILGWAAGAAAVVALLWLVLARATALRLSRLTARVERHAAGEGAEALPVHRRDEIGRLARSIEHMQARIDQRVKELEEARASAERSDRIRRDLVANMSHEVRTPLNTIIGMAGEIDAAELGDGDRQRLALVLRSAQRLRGLVDDLLLHARASEGRLVLDARPSDVRTVLMDLAQAHLPAAQARGIALRCDVRSLPDRLRVDPLRLHQIADNLLGNAVRFTVQGQVDLTARMADGRLVLEVSDTGPGIAPELQARVFERFERAAASEATDGAGLGLAITHRLVEAMGGRITLHSAVGQGSRFTVELPVEVVTGHEVPAPASGVADTAGLRVLYVEDVESNRLLMEQWAMKWGWSLVQAADAEAALAATARQDFDLVLIDQDLGQGVRGTELLFRLRGLKRFRYVPMLVVTAFVDLEHAAEAFKAGANDRITKPIDPLALQAAAAFWCLRDQADGADPVQVDALALHYDNDPEKVLRAFQQFRKEFGAARVALQAAVEQGDADGLAEVRHRIRPHWQLLGQVEGVRALDALNVADRQGWPAVESVFRRCDRALMTAQRALLTGGPAA